MQRNNRNSQNNNIEQNVKFKKISPYFKYTDYVEQFEKEKKA